MSAMMKAVAIVCTPVLLVVSGLQAVVLVTWDSVKRRIA